MTTRKLAFETPTHEGIVFRAFYLYDADGKMTSDADIDIVRDEKVVQTFAYPAYKIWNISAHAEDIIDGELSGNARGWYPAGSDGLGGYVLPKEKTEQP